jgi:hypothetical protein
MLQGALSDAKLLKGQYNKGYFDDATRKALLKYCQINNIEYPGYIDAKLWEALGLPMNSTLSEEFFGTDEKEYNTWIWDNKDIQFRIEGNSITFDYFPKYYFEGGMSQEYEQNYIKAFESAITGIWNRNMEVLGVQASIKINIVSETVAKKKNANVIVTSSYNQPQESTSEIYGNVDFVGKEIFHRGTKSVMYLDAKYTYSSLGNEYNLFIAHEFGHVIGLEDAAEWNETLGTRVPIFADRLMSGGGTKLESDDIEMILWAWLLDTGQFYTNPEKGKQMSRALFE